jgi:hypothetical protein
MPLIPLLKEGEISLLLPPLFIREGWGGISFIAFFHKIYIPSHRLLKKGGLRFFFSFEMVLKYLA